MEPEREPLGRCPDCGAVVPRTCLLIEYETEDGSSAAYAECPDCAEVVRPVARCDDPTAADG